MSFALAVIYGFKDNVEAVTRVSATNLPASLNVRSHRFVDEVTHREVLIVRGRRPYFSLRFKAPLISIPKQISISKLSTHHLDTIDVVPTWHESWQRAFPYGREYAEKLGFHETVSDDQKSFRADVCTRYKDDGDLYTAGDKDDEGNKSYAVIELQHSRIEMDKIVRRERFWQSGLRRYAVWWIFDFWRKDVKQVKLVSTDAPSNNTRMQTKKRKESAEEVAALPVKYRKEIEFKSLGRIVQVFYDSSSLPDKRTVWAIVSTDCKRLLTPETRRFIDFGTMVDFAEQKRVDRRVIGEVRAQYSNRYLLVQLWTLEEFWAKFFPFRSHQPFPSCLHHSDYPAFAEPVLALPGQFDFGQPLPPPILHFHPNSFFSIAARQRPTGWPRDIADRFVELLPHVANIKINILQMVAYKLCSAAKGKLCPRPLTEHLLDLPAKSRIIDPSNKLVIRHVNAQKILAYGTGAWEPCCVDDVVIYMPEVPSCQFSLADSEAIPIEKDLSEVLYRLMDLHRYYLDVEHATLDLLLQPATLIWIPPRSAMLENRLRTRQELVSLVTENLSHLAHIRVFRHNSGQPGKKEESESAEMRFSFFQDVATTGEVFFRVKNHSATFEGFWNGDVEEELWPVRDAVQNKNNLDQRKQHSATWFWDHQSTTTAEESGSESCGDDERDILHTATVPATHVRK